MFESRNLNANMPKSALFSLKIRKNHPALGLRHQAPMPPSAIQSWLLGKSFGYACYTLFFSILLKKMKIFSVLVGAAIFWAT